MYHKSYKAAIIIALCIAFNSCGAKKRTVDKKEEIIKIDSVASSIKTIDLNKFIKQLKFIPVDVDKPIIINRDTIYNTRIEFVEKKVDSIVYIKDTVVVEKEVETKTKAVDSERDGFNWKSFNWAMVLVVVALLLFLAANLLYKKPNG